MGEIQGTSTSEHTDRRGWQHRTRRNIAAATLLVYGSTFLWMTSSFAGTNRPPGGAAWVIADVGALVSLALFTLAAWGVFRSKWWWERAASAIRCSDTVTMPGGERRADALIAAAPSRGWQRISAGAGAHGPREYDWARIPVRTGQKCGRGHWLLARRSVSDPAEIAYYACYGPRRSSTADLAWIAGSRWHDRLHAPGDPPPADQPGPGLRTRPRGRLALVTVAPATAVPGSAMPLPAPRLRTHLSGRRVASSAVAGAAGLVPGARLRQQDQRRT
jgi:hypothetical protein